mmetsp:Transcript_24082/g.56943  ORF Transcript_24082/g.56943 Transcript_24082/m.56943 type:complete len:209 (+) Transcript_24082:1538-2164(+)
MTPVYGIFLSSAGLARSNLAYHSVLIPSLIPFSLSPVYVNFSMIWLKTSSSISFRTCNALDANWIGPPKRLNSSVRSNTTTSIFGFFARLFANANPPTPAPAIMTLSGWSFVISYENAPSLPVVIDDGEPVATPNSVGVDVDVVVVVVVVLIAAVLEDDCTSKGETNPSTACIVAALVVTAESKRIELLDLIVATSSTMTTVEVVADR